MGHARRERAQGRKPVTPSPLLLVSFLLAEVLEEGERAEQRPVPPFQGQEAETHRQHIARSRDRFHLPRLLGGRAGPGGDVRLSAGSPEDARHRVPDRLLGGIAQELGGGGIDGQERTLPGYREEAEGGVAKEAPRRVQSFGRRRGGLVPGLENASGSHGSGVPRVS